MIPIISVVVSVYRNTYLKPCIDSILQQSFQDFELLLVEDGSPDNSGSICDEYAAKDNRIRVIHKQNEGSNRTRCRGVQEAKGEWIVFCDDDDTMPQDALESLYAKHQNTELVIGFLNKPEHPVGAITLDQSRASSITSKLFSSSPCAKLYHHSLLTPNVFDIPKEINYGEDMIMNIRIIFSLSRPPKICNKQVYNYRINTSSVSHTKRSSLKYEIAFDKARKNSIPNDLLPNYMPEIIKSKINGIAEVAYAEPQVMARDEHQYIKKIKLEVKQYKYHTSLREWLLINVRKAWMLKIIAFCILVKTSLCYRLGISH
jgi:glycosyltransferase involved in cell wall biosynthesis